MEADHPSLPQLHRGGAQVSGRAQRDRRDVARGVFLRVEGQHLLALGHDDLRGIREELLQVGLAETLLRGIDRLTDGDVPTLQEGVGTLAARSALAVVVPVDALRHGVALSIRTNASAEFWPGSRPPARNQCAVLTCRKGTEKCPAPYWLFALEDEQFDLPELEGVTLGLE